MNKICSKCDEEKSLSDFAQDKRYSSGRYPSCKRCKQSLQKIYYMNNREKVIKLDVARKVKKYNTDVDFNIKHRLRSRLRTALDRQYRSGLAIDHLGCSIEDFKLYLESKFLPGMSWSNRSEWQIDHVIPLCKFDLKNDKQIKIACHFSNLQPLWIKDHLSKTAIDIRKVRGK